MYQLRAFRGQSISLYPAHAPRTVPCSALNKSPALLHALKMIAGRQPALESPMFSLLVADTTRTERGQARPAAAQGTSSFFCFWTMLSPLRKHKAMLQHNIQGCSQTCKNYKRLLFKNIYKLLRIIPPHYQIPTWRTPCCYSVVFRVTAIPPIFISHLRLQIQSCSVPFPPIMNR